MALPDSILIREEGPREGFQMHKEFIATEKKLQLIKELSGTGIEHIQVASFVRPDVLPQMKDAPAIAESLPQETKVRYSALYLNKKGLNKAQDFHKLNNEGYILLAASESFFKRNNNKTIDEGINRIPEMLDALTENNLELERLMLSTAFGDNSEGYISKERVLGICEKAIKKIERYGLKLHEITFADTAGYANPASVTSLVNACKERFTDIEIGLHLHDTRGLGIANAYAALLCGIRRFDAAVGGMGGCPFMPGAAGNIATEDLVFLCNELGIKTGINLEKYIKCAKLAEDILGYTLPGKLKSGGITLKANQIK